MPRFFPNIFRSALPAVLINTPVHDSQYATLNIDNYGGAFAMTQHLIGRGFRSIAFVTGPDANFDASERLRGFNDAIARSEKPSTRRSCTAISPKNPAIASASS